MTLTRPPGWTGNRYQRSWPGAVIRPVVVLLAPTVSAVGQVTLMSCGAVLGKPSTWQRSAKL